jgi:hypothetical protein
MMAKQRFVCAKCKVAEITVKEEVRCPCCEGPMYSGDFPTNTGNIWRNWQSSSMGVGRKQVAAANADAVQRGLPVSFDPATGKAKCTSRSDANRTMEANGFVNWDGGFGDYTGK